MTSATVDRPAEYRVEHAFWECNRWRSTTNAFPTKEAAERSAAALVRLGAERVVVTGPQAKDPQ